jgi:cysteine-rich CPCC protein
MDINDHDRHQYRRMRWAIADFERDLIGLHNLIADLEALFGALEVAPPALREAFRQAWDRLRDIHIAAGGDNRPQPTSSEDIVRSPLASIKELLASVPKLPCPCCGYLMFGAPPGSDDHCKICFWQDDVVQLRFPNFAGGANKPSLMEAQRNFAEFGAKEIRHLQNVRPTTAEDIRDRDWRPVDPLRDLFAALDRRDGTDDWPTERSRLYYWRPDFWRSGLR